MTRDSISTQLWLRYPFRIGRIHHWWQPGTISVHWSHCSPLCFSCCCIICLPLNSKGNKQTSVGPGADGYFQHSLLCSPYIWLRSSSLSFKENHLPAAGLRFFLSRKLHGQSYDEHVSFSTVQTRVNWLQSITSLPKRHRLSAITRFRNPHQRTY